MTPTKKTTTRKPSVRVKLPPNPFVHEILELVDSQRTKAKKIEILREYDDLALKAILIWNFDPTAISVLPEGPVPYKENEVPIGTDHTRLETEYKGLYRFVKGGQDKLPSLKRETMFVQLLEGLSKDEAELICLAKDKKITSKYKRITKAVVQEAFPQIVWGKRS